MHVYTEVLTVSAPKGTNICEFAKHRFIYNRIYDITYVYCELQHVSKEVLTDVSLQNIGSSTIASMI